MKSIKDLCLINEAKNVRIYPEDYTTMESEEDLVNCIIETLIECDMIDAMAQSIEESLDPHIFEDQDFLKSFGNRLNELVLECYEQNYD